MATASELDKIRCNPIKDRLATFRHRFESTRSNLDVPSSSDVTQTVFSTAVTAGMAQFLMAEPLLIYIDVKNLVLDLIQALQIEPAARTLPSRIAERTLSGDLGLLYSRVDANQLDIASAIPLVEQIVSNKPNAPTWNDADIWHAVFELVA
jgi:hypothetical protein